MVMLLFSNKIVIFYSSTYRKTFVYFELLRIGTGVLIRAWYELVQACRPKIVSAANAACNSCVLECKTFSSILTAINSGKG